MALPVDLGVVACRCVTLFCLSSHGLPPLHLCPNSSPLSYVTGRCAWADPNPMGPHLTWMTPTKTLTNLRHPFFGRETNLGELVHMHKALRTAVIAVVTTGPETLEKAEGTESEQMTSEAQLWPSEVPPPPSVSCLSVSYARISSFPLATLLLKHGLSDHLFMCGKCIKIYKINPLISRRELACCPE